MRLGAIEGVGVAPRQGQDRPPSAQASEERSGRALVAIASRAPVLSEPPWKRPEAAFLAHLIATASDAPQTRQRRRAEPQDVHVAYAARTDLDRPAPARCWIL